LVAYFKEILPDYDDDRVYVSDIKKVLNWYNLLQAKGMVSKEEPTQETLTESAEVEKELVGEELKKSKSSKTKK
jgi:hypothetical protein